VPVKSNLLTLLCAATSAVRRPAEGSVNWCSFDHPNKRPCGATGAAGSDHGAVDQKNHDPLDDSDNHAGNADPLKPPRRTDRTKSSRPVNPAIPIKMSRQKAWPACLLSFSAASTTFRRVCSQATLLLASARIGTAYPGTLGKAWCCNRNGGASMLIVIDRVCGQFAAALQHQQLHIYATIAVIVVLSVLLFPPRNDPDQI
jgi:hypothetical protein